MTAAPTTLKGFTWNVHVGRSPKMVQQVVADLLTTYNADVAVLQEAASYYRVLRALPGYRLYTGQADREGRSTCVLVRRGIPVPRVRLLVTRLAWWGPKAGKRHVGRTFPVVDLGRWRGPRWRVVGIHRVPGGPRGGTLTHGRNRPEWNAEHVELVTLAHRRSSQRRALVMPGDWNCEADDEHPRGVWAYAQAVGAMILPTRTKVDHVVVRGCHGKARRRENYGSDHPLVTFTLHQGAR